MAVYRDEAIPAAYLELIEELAQVTCPIGVSGITGKEPEVIAVAVAAQLLQRLGTN